MAQEPKKRVCVIGGGIAGLSCSFALSPHVEVTLLERHGKLGSKCNSNLNNACLEAVSVSCTLIDHYCPLSFRVVVDAHAISVAVPGAGDVRVDVPLRVFSPALVRFTTPSPHLPLISI